MKSNRFFEKHWNRWPLRSRLLAIMLSIAILILLISTAGFVTGSLRMQSLVNQHSMQMSQGIGGAVRMAFYQQNMCIYSGVAQAQAAYLEDAPEDVSADGPALLDMADQYFRDVFPQLWTPDSICFVWQDSHLYSNAQTDALPLMQALVDECYGDLTIQQLLSDQPLENLYSSGEQGYFLLWETFREDCRVGMLMPTSNSYDLTVALTEMLDSESRIASEGIRSATVTSLLISLGVIAALLILLPPVARKLASIITTPVEQEQARRERELLLAAEEKRMLEELDRKKTEFLANISHELKTPLTAVSSYAQSSAQGLSEIPKTERESRAMRMIVTEVNRMALLVNQLLDVSRIEEGRLSLNRKPVQIDALIKRTLDTYAPILQENDNRLVFNRVYDLPEIQADEIRIQEVLVNLLSNAAKHTRGGTITVGMAQAAQHVEISVSDTGDGVSPEEIPHIFERFHTHSASQDPAQESKKARTDAKTSTGLGLYLCKSFVEAHGGTIAMESALGAGTTVRFTLPTETASGSEDSGPRALQ